MIEIRKFMKLYCNKKLYLLSWQTNYFSCKKPNNILKIGLQDLLQRGASLILIGYVEFCCKQQIIKVQC